MYLMDLMYTWKFIRTYYFKEPIPLINKLMFIFIHYDIFYYLYAVSISKETTSWVLVIYFLKILKF